MNQEKTLIMGLGNVLLQDEGIGVHVLNELKKQTWPDNVDLLDGGTGGFVLLSLFQEYSKMIIIDATLNDKPEGSIDVIRPRFASDFPKSLSTHDLGLKDMVESAILLEKIPDITLITVSINPRQDMNMELSPALKKQIPAVIDTVHEVLNNG